MKGWRFIIIGIVVVLIPGLLIGYLLRPSPIVQPIQFNHKIHLESESLEGQENITCETCHKYYNTRIVAGRPSINTCLTCHATSSGKNPEIDKLLEFGKRGEEIPWKKIYDLPDHVFFSHRRHTGGLQYLSGVEAAEFRKEYKDEEQDNGGGKQVREPIKCETCHGPIAETVTPPPAPLKKITMKSCLTCHKQEQVTVDCNACHR